MKNEVFVIHKELIAVQEELEELWNIQSHRVRPGKSNVLFTFKLDQLLFPNPAGLSVNQVQVTGALHNAHLLSRNLELHNFGMHVQLCLKNKAITAIQDQNQTCANN